VDLKNASFRILYDMKAKKIVMVVFYPLLRRGKREASI